MLRVLSFLGRVSDTFESDRIYMHNPGRIQCRITMGLVPSSAVHLFCMRGGSSRFDPCYAMHASVGHDSLL